MRTEDTMFEEKIADPAKVSSTSEDAVASFKSISSSKQTFVSRADDSGTHKKELSIWEKAGIKPSGDWYIEAAAGMGDVITMTNEKEGYTLSDRATWLNVGKDTDLKILCEKDPSGMLNNQYGVICVNPDKNDKINHDGGSYQKTHRNLSVNMVSRNTASSCSYLTPNKPASNLSIFF